MKQDALCDLLDREGKDSLEVAVCREASQNSSRAFWALLIQGYLLVNQKKWSEAIQSLQHAIRGFPFSADLWEEASEIAKSCTLSTGNISCIWKLYGDIQKRTCYLAAVCAGNSYQWALHLMPWLANVYIDVAIAMDMICALKGSCKSDSNSCLLPEGDNFEFWEALGCLFGHKALKHHAFIRGLQLDAVARIIDQEEMCYLLIFFSSVWLSEIGLASLAAVSGHLSSSQMGNALDAVWELEDLKGEGLIDVEGLQIYAISLWQLGKNELALSATRDFAKLVSAMGEFSGPSLCRVHATTDNYINPMEEYMRCLNLQTDYPVGWMCFKFIESRYDLQDEVNSVMRGSEVV
ncbi:hypothetical protein Ancab_036955 [Ancistrocladus abbreviatus]